MKKKVFLLTIAVSFLLFNSCAFWNTVVYPSGLGAYAHTDKFSVQIIECFGNASTQEIAVVLMITNNGFNERRWIGSASNTMAVDNQGNTLKPFRSAGVLLDFPTGVPVRVTIERMGPIFAGTPMLRILRVEIGSSKNIVEFRNVPIVW